MAARIRSQINHASPIDEASRDDVLVGDILTLSSLDAATTYSWALVDVPYGSSATFSGSLTSVSPGSFTADVDGAYLVRLIVNAGTGSEDTQYVRLRVLTEDLGLRLTAAGERRDESGVVPVDAEPGGWSSDLNRNLKSLEAAVVARISSILELTSGEAVPSGVPVGLDDHAGGGRVVVANATVGAILGRGYPIGFSTSSASGTGEVLSLSTIPGTLVAATFDTTPSSSDQGLPVYLHTVGGEVSMTAPSASGTIVYQVGILQDWNTSTLFWLPQYVTTNP